MSQDLNPGGGGSISPAWSVTALSAKDSALNFSHSMVFSHYYPDQISPIFAEEFSGNLSATADAGNSNLISVFNAVPLPLGSYVSNFTHADHEIVGSTPSMLNVGGSLGGSTCCRQATEDEGSGSVIGLNYGAELTQGAVNAKTTINGSGMSMHVSGGGAQGKVTAGVTYHEASGNSNGVSDETNYTQNIEVNGDYSINYSVSFGGGGNCPSLCPWR